MQITYQKKKIRRTLLQQTEGVPSLESAINVQNRSDVKLSEDEGLFIGYGFRRNAYPYENQNRYSELVEGEIDTIVIENDCLSAEFLPGYGGRLWSLTDKESGRNLLYTNDVISHRNMAIRNAWFSGGVEWNIGSVGHTYLTNEAMYVSEVTDESGKKYIRMYEFERLRGVAYQMDFWLEGEQLLCRFRIDNRNTEMIPMYWWSNIAVYEHQGGRVIAPADEAYKSGDVGYITKVSYPLDKGNDMSFYNKIPVAVDYFFDIKQSEKKFIANVDSDGFGLLQCSSERLAGRKLFSWGHTQGARNWQDYLTDKAGDYIEIQAGLAKTQYECIPMPPFTAWEWIESYSKVEIESEMVKGDYKVAVNAVKNEVDILFNELDLDALVTETKAMAKSNGKLIMKGSGAGPLEKLVSPDILPEHLDFDEKLIDESWAYFMTYGYFPDGDDTLIPTHFPTGEKIMHLLEQSSKNKGKKQSLVWYYLGIIYYDKEMYEQAYTALNNSIELDENAFTYHGLAYTSHRLCKSDVNDLICKSIKLMPHNYSLVESMVKLLLDREAYADVLELKPLIDESIINDRLKMYFSMAYLSTGNIDEAEKLLYTNGGLTIQDMREGELSLSSLWHDIQKAKKIENICYENMPKDFDFRML